jgi:hypothetical protein
LIVTPAAYAAALLIALAAALLGLSTAGAGVDFPQYYLGATMVRENQWEALYPVPLPASDQNAGYPEASAMKPAYARRAAALGMGDTFRFTQPPPFALALVPLSLLSPPQARVAWAVLMAVCLWASAAVSARVYRHLAGRVTLAEAGIVCGSVLLPRALLSTRLGNISPFVGLCLATGLYGMIARPPKPVRGGSRWRLLHQIHPLRRPAGRASPTTVPTLLSVSPGRGRLASAGVAN